MNRPVEGIPPSPHSCLFQPDWPYEDTHTSGQRPLEDIPRFPVSLFNLPARSTRNLSWLSPTPGKSKAFPLGPADLGSRLEYRTMPSNFVSPFPIPLNPEAPQGSLVYDSTASASINSSGDTDSFTILLNAGQTATVAVVPATGLQAMVSLSNSTNHLLGSPGRSSGPGGGAADSAHCRGRYLHHHHSRSQRHNRELYGQLVLNAALQTESNGGTPGSDDTIATAQNIDSAFGPLGHGGSGRCARRCSGWAHGRRCLR